MAINRVIVTGRLTRNSELRATTNGTQVLEFSIAVSDYVRNRQTDEWEEKPNFFDCVMFGKNGQDTTPEKRSLQLTKGVKVTIDGKLRQERWEKDGETRTRVKIAVHQIEIDLPKRNANEAPAAYEDIPF